MGNLLRLSILVLSLRVLLSPPNDTLDTLDTGNIDTINMNVYQFQHKQLDDYNFYLQEILKAFKLDTL